MNADELMKRIAAYGADMEGIRDRFGDNAELYELCFSEFLEEPSFAALSSALEAGDLARAFDAAHALKGISGNLGLCAFYDAICELVESLRARNGGDTGEQYARVERQRMRLVRLFSGEGDTPAEGAPLSDAAGKKSALASLKKKNDSFAAVAVLTILAVLLLVSFLFCRISVTFRKNTMKESGQHLAEMCSQIRIYIEEQVANDWRVAQSVGDSITDGSYMQDDGALLEMLQKRQEIWGCSDLMLYTENGYCVYTDGSSEKNDVASDTIVRARQQGKYLSVINSRLIYTIPLETSLQYRGSKIAAVSVVQDMGTFLDDMHFSSFNEKAWLYLTEDSGIVISRLTNPNAAPVFNIRAIADGMKLTPLGKNSAAKDFLFTPEAEPFLMEDGERAVYAVSVPVTTGSKPLWLFYLASEDEVNKTMNGFSQQLTVFSMTIILLFAVLATLGFLFLYQSRRKLFDRAISSRERMFDLLIQNTRTAFGLFKIGQTAPAYISSNAASVVGDPYWVFEQDEAGYHVRNGAGAETEALRQANEMLRGWDGKSPFKSGYIYYGQDAAPYYFDFQLYPVEGDGTDFVGIAQDVTQAYERERATKEAMELATRANEAKSRFLSNMSHDIRTPMNAIVNMTDFALENIDQPKRLGMYLHTIRESSDHLLRLINDVLDMSRIESGQTVVESAPFDLRAQIARQLEMIRPLCEAKGQTLLADYDGLFTTSVCGDALKLSQIIMNLLSNAVKFTPEKGAVRFAAMEIASLRSDIVDVRFTVEDNGIGISEENRQRIFDPFFRAQDRRVGKIEGTGLGLSICKSYVEAMGGTMRCESEEGEGSIFTVELFFRKADAASISEKAPAMIGDTPFLGLHCLVMEDNPTNQLIAKALLERLGFITDFADDGREGVQKFAASKPGTYDIIYMDVQMPVMDGCQATVAIRASGHPQAGSIPIVAMTANVFAEDIERVRVAGMDGFVGKPIVSFDLAEQTGKAIQKKKGRTR